MRPSTKNVILLSLNIAVWCGNGLIATGMLTLSAKKGVPVRIETIPERTKLSLNGSPWTSPTSSSSWLQSPATIYLPEGQHKLTVERPGYVQHSFKVLLSAGDAEMNLSTALEPLSAATHEVEIQAADDHASDVTAIVDQGLASGELPLQISDLTPGTHTLEIKPSLLSSFSLKPYTCVFTLPTPSNSPLKITVSQRAGRFHATGCQRLKKLP